MWPELVGTAASIATAVAFYRIHRWKRQLSELTRQLRRYNRSESGQKLVLDWHDAALEELAEEINRHTALIERAQAEQRRSETELRQAVANVSHDLRTPLTSISGYIQVLEQEGLTDAERKDAISVIRHRTARLKALLDDFFELSVLDSPDYRLNLGAVALGRLIPEILLGFYDRLSERRLQPDLRLEDAPLPATADEAAVRRVVENLMLNTLRHAQGAIRIELRRRDNDAVLELRNDAPHLRGHDPELLFNRFYMADRSRSAVRSGEPGGGTGLGLSIARGLMEKMGGSLRAELEGDSLLLTCRWRLAGQGSN
ncbi:sensor histidine kinase [Cohnella fermenti]|uniref:sensor histidine kinase n=1 Tax=Cohnella fermenti TaxID=2565925 RepID=UPI001454CFA5|nr:HAMP domain-containing sensor histidine kinase [Cohnella fermenti]